jgi:hypothetical protein
MRMRRAEVMVEDPEVQGTQYVDASRGSTRVTSDAEGMRMRGTRVRVEDPEVQGTQYVGASNGEETLTLAGSKGMRTSSAAASARVEGPEVQGTLESSEVNTWMKNRVRRANRVRREGILPVTGLLSPSTNVGQ